MTERTAAALASAKTARNLAGLGRILEKWPDFGFA